MQCEDQMLSSYCIFMQYGDGQKLSFAIMFWKAGKVLGIRQHYYTQLFVGPISLFRVTVIHPEGLI